jgi:membrane-bound lytic murein transglycosylase D
MNTFNPISRSGLLLCLTGFLVVWGCASTPPPSVKPAEDSTLNAADISDQPVDFQGDEAIDIDAPPTIDELEALEEESSEDLDIAEEVIEFKPDPESVQQEALEHCQSASEFLNSGEIDNAIAALDRAYELMLALPNNGDIEYLQAKEDIRRLVADLITRTYGSQRTVAAEPRTSLDLEISIASNEQVQREIKSFTTVERDVFIEGYRRSGLYRPMILAKLEEAGLPSQLSWMPLVESWFKVRALSRASALGMWQFIHSTGLRYGLGRDTWIDERMDPEKSTDAAIAYLTELHDLFGS